MAHWIIELLGFAGAMYTCSNCEEVFSDDVLCREFCPKCHERINEDENEYIS